MKWNTDEPISKEYALSVVDSVKSFMRGRFHLPLSCAFNGKTDFELWMAELDELQKFITKRIPDDPEQPPGAGKRARRARKRRGRIRPMDFREWDWRQWYICGLLTGAQLFALIAAIVVLIYYYCSH